jgi:S1-C subfamily serine protease
MVACGVAVVLFGLGVRGDGPARAAAPADSREQDNLAVVALDARVGDDPVHSSGIVIDPRRGLVITSNRAVWGATSLRVGTGLGLQYGRILARAPCDDLAVVEILPQLPGLVALPGASSAPAPGSLLTSIGRRRVVSDYGPDSLLTIPAPAGNPRGERRLDLDARVVPEATGGPLVDRQGRIVAMVQSGPKSNPAAPSQAMLWPAVRQRLGELKPGARQLYVGWRDQYRCVAKLNAETKAAHPGFQARDAWLNAPVPATRVPGVGGVDNP